MLTACLMPSALHTELCSHLLCFPCRQEEKLERCKITVNHFRSCITVNL